jgi:hypothetical protein
MNTKGVIYTAGGMQRYIDEAIYSAKTLKKYNPKLGTTLYTSIKNVESKYFDNIIYQEPIKHPQKYKVENMLKSPYDFTLFLDSDTEIKDNIEELFDFLLIYDIGVTNRVKCKWSANPIYIYYIDNQCYNGGFLLFKKNKKVTTFINAWTKKMNKNKDEEIKAGTQTGDQIPLNELFFDEKLPEKIGLKYVILPNKIYNARPWLWEQAKTDGDYKNIKIFHARGLNKHKSVKILNKIKHKLRNG